MDWIEDKQSRIRQLNMRKHGVKVSKTGNYQTVPKMATSAPTFKKLSLLAIFKLNPTIDFIVMLYKMKCVLPSLDIFEHQFAIAQKVTLKLQ